VGGLVLWEVAVAVVLKPEGGLAGPFRIEEEGNIWRQLAKARGGWGKIRLRLESQDQ